MSDEQPEKNLIQFKPRDEVRPPVIRKPHNYEGCRHKYAEVDEGLWRLECQDCHEVLDPINFLLTVVAIYEERDYKFKMIEEFQAKEQAKREKRRAQNR